MGHYKPSLCLPAPSTCHTALVNNDQDPHADHGNAVRYQVTFSPRLLPRLVLSSGYLCRSRIGRSKVASGVDSAPELGEGPHKLCLLLEPPHLSTDSHQYNPTCCLRACHQPAAIAVATMASASTQPTYGSPPPQTLPWSLYSQTTARAESDSARREDSFQENLDNSDEESGQDGDEKDGSRKRKRPMSVSCELCKQRKVKCESPALASSTPIT